MWGNGAAPNMDEIRFGDSYLDVIGQGTDTSGDFTPPTPATMSFATPPAATSTTAITMTATAASDANGVQYFFDETSGNPGGTDSGWQDSPVHTDTGLNPNTQYTYTVQARDKSVNNNPNTVSSPASATTFPPDTTPPSPATMSFATPPAASSTTSITMTATTASDASGVEYFFDETSGNPGATDSAWQDSPTYTDTGLNPNTQYTYTVRARDKSPNNNANTASSPASATTFPPDTNPPPTPGFSVAPNATSSSAITMTATTVTDPEGGSVEYFFDETSGNPGGTDSAWQSSPTYTDSGLNPSTQYTYTVKARDNSSPPNESAASAPASATTLASALRTQFWDGTGGDGNWNTAANWGGDGLPAFSTTAINFGSLSSAAGTAFGNVVVPTQTTANNNLTAGTVIKGINFGNTGVANRTAAYTLTGNSIILGTGTNDSITTTAITAGGAAIQDVISLNIDLGSGTGAQNRVFNTGTNHNLKVDGVISGTSTTWGLMKQGLGTLTLTSTSNSYLGSTNITANPALTGAGNSVLEVTKLADGGLNSSIGAASSSIQFSAAVNSSVTNTLRHIGSANSSTNRGIHLAGNIAAGTNSVIESSGDGTLSFTGSAAITFTNSGVARNFYLGGTNAGNNVFNLALSNNGAGLSTLTKRGAGKWIITGNHSYTGATNVEEGTLLINGSTSTTSVVSVAANATLGGTGTIGGSVTVAAAGSIAPGASAGTLSISGGLDISAQVNGGSGKLKFELGADTANSDQLAVTGTLTTGGKLGFSDFTFTSLPGGPQNVAYTLITTGADPTALLDGANLSGPIGVGGTGTLSASGNNIILTVAGLGGGGVTFADWKTANGNPAGSLGDDHDNDGVNNGTEYFLGGTTGTPPASPPLPGVANTAGTLSVTWTKAADLHRHLRHRLRGGNLRHARRRLDHGTHASRHRHNHRQRREIHLPAGTKNFARLKVTGPN